MTVETYAAYLAVCVVAIVVPGPTNTLIVANGMRFGARAGLLNVAGTQLAVAIMIGIVGIGLTSLITAAGQWFAWVKLIGAAYLVYIGIQMLRSSGRLHMASAPRAGFFMQGFLVAASNPKQLVFFGALLPQFVDPTQSHVLQVAMLGGTAIVVGTLSDSAYALAAGRIAGRFTERRVKWVSRVGGGFLVAGGVWLALARAR